MRKTHPLRVASDIAARMRELRDVLGLNQDAFADLFGRGWKQASEWERGNQAPPATALRRAAKAQGWPEEIFAEGGRSPRELVNAPLTESGTGGMAPSPTSPLSRVNGAPGAAGLTDAQIPDLAPRQVLLAAASEMLGGGPPMEPSRAWWWILRAFEAGQRAAIEAAAAEDGGEDPAVGGSGE